MTTNTVQINGVKLMKKGVKSATGKYSPCWYSLCRLTNGKTAITIYAKGLPRELGSVENNTETQTDYFESDRVRFYEGTPEFNAVMPLVRKEVA